MLCQLLVVLEVVRNSDRPNIYFMIRNAVYTEISNLCDQHDSSYSLHDAGQLKHTMRFRYHYKFTVCLSRSINNNAAD